MENVVKETETTQIGDASAVTTPTEKKATGYQTGGYSVYYFFGALEILLVFRLVLKLMGANLSSGFVKFIYGLTGFFIVPFENIFRRGLSEGIETTSVFEPSTVVAIIVYSVVAWGIVKLIRIISKEQQPS